MSLVLATASLGCGDDDPTASTSTTTTTTAGGNGGTGGTGGTTSEGGGGTMMAVAPEPPGNVTADHVRAPHGVDLAWAPSPSTDVAGYLVARSTASIAAADGPENGTNYGVGDSLPGGAIVVAVPSSVTANEADDSLFGNLVYTVWARSEDGLFSTGVEASVDLPLAEAQAAAITVDGITSAPVVTVSEAPPHATLTGTATYDGGQQELTISLTLRNDAPRIMFNPKVRLDGLTEGLVDLDQSSAGRLGGVPIAYFGEAMAVGGDATRDIVITGVTADTLNLDISIMHHHTVVIGALSGPVLADSSGATEETGTASFSRLISMSAFKHKVAGHQSSFNGYTFTSDGSKLVGGLFTAPHLVAVDVTTATPVASADLTSGQVGVGTITDVRLSPDGSAMFAVVTAHAHAHPDGTQGALDGALRPAPIVDLVRLDPNTLVETGRLNLVDGGVVQAVGRNITFSADGSMAAVPVFNEAKVFLVDTANMMLIQAIDVSGTSTKTHSALLTPSGDALLVRFRHGDGTVLVIDTATFAQTPVAPAALSLDSRPGGMLWSPSGIGLLTEKAPGAGGAGVLLFDATTTTTTAAFVGEDVKAVGFSPAGDRMYVQRAPTESVSAHDPETMAQVDLDGDASNGMGLINSSDIGNSSHYLHTSPY